MQEDKSLNKQAIDILKNKGDGEWGKSVRKFYNITKFNHVTLSDDTVGSESNLITLASIQDQKPNILFRFT